MKSGIQTWTVATLTLAVAAWLPTVAAAGGFSVFEQGTKAMGMAGAFTAQADDPSALFHNVGGLAFFDEREIAVGLTLITSTDESFVGLPPEPGPDARGSLESLREPLPHLYWVQPVGERWRFGLAINAPFGLKTEWENPDAFPGRFINTEASLLVIDLNPNLGVRVSDDLGLGFGLIVRSSEVELNRRQQAPHPVFGRPVDVARVGLESDMEQGYGWQAGLLHHASDRVSWGFSYRSTVSVDYSGTARFQQIPIGILAFDQFIAGQIPFDRDLDIETGIEFPDTASLGVAVEVTPAALVELDVNWAGWSTFDVLPITFPNVPPLSIRRPENWDDVYNYRLGLRWSTAGASEWRFGFVYDESPQPTRAVSPLLPDADRNGYTVGWGHEGPRYDLDLALMYLDFDDRTNDRSQDGFNGTYSQTGWLLAATVGF